jgi:hypothetical protein
MHTFVLTKLNKQPKIDICAEEDAMSNLYLNGASQLTVKLTIGAGVALQDAELWRLVDQNGALSFVKLRRNSTNVSTADWNIAINDAAVVALQLYWDAIEPNEPEWSYPGKIEVTDQNGDHLKGRSSSHRNPQVHTYKIGPIPPHGSSEVEKINVW